MKKRDKTTRNQVSVTFFFLCVERGETISEQNVALNLSFNNWENVRIF